MRISLYEPQRYAVIQIADTRQDEPERIVYCICKVSNEADTWTGKNTARPRSYHEVSDTYRYAWIQEETQKIRVCDM